ncbi:MAG: response regulator transcription factor [Leptospiraceae bacterium]|nr:response regulator transcription factor [Leptospiraceae bacterium]
MRILIVEDEMVAARGLRNNLKDIAELQTASIRIHSTLTAAECFVQENVIDLLFLDLNLNGDDGFELLQTAVAGSFQTIIVSANTDRAIEAFRYGVFDFLPKPVNKSQLHQSVLRWIRSEKAVNQDMKLLAVKEDDKIRLLSLTEIQYLQGHDNYVLIHLLNGETLRHRKTLDSLAALLPDSFLRLHRSFIVPQDHVAEIQNAGGGQYNAILKDGETIPVGRSRVKNLKTRFQMQS